MSIPRIIYQDLSTVTFGTEYTVALPVANLNNYLVNSYWQSTTASGQWVTMDMGSSIAKTDIVIDGHNLNGCTVTVATANDANMTGYSTKATLTGFTNDTPYHATFSTATSRYWGIYINGASVAPRIGNVMLSEAVVFTTPYDGQFKAENPEYNVSSKTSLSGIKRGSKTYKGRLVYELKFSYQSTVLKTAFQTFTKTVCGSQYPFYFKSADDVVRYMVLDSDYVPVTTVAYGWNSIESLVMKTQEAKY